MDGTLALNDCAIRVILTLLGMLLDDTDSLDQHLRFRWKHCDNFTAGSLVIAADDLDEGC